MEEAKRGKSGPWVIISILIAALAVSYYHWNRHTNQEKKYATVMKSYSPPIKNNIPSQSTKNNSLKNAIKEFDLKNYDTSYTLLKEINPKTDVVYWYLGHIALLDGKVYEARNYSKKISDTSLKSDISKYVDEIISN